MSALASVLPMTFDYCGVKQASTEFDLCIISVQPCVWISRHTCMDVLEKGFVWNCGAWISIALLPLLIWILFFLLFITLAFRFLSSVPLISSSLGLLSPSPGCVTIYSQLKWFRRVHVCAFMWPWPDTKRWMKNTQATPINMECWLQGLRSEQQARMKVFGVFFSASSSSSSPSGERRGRRPGPDASVPDTVWERSGAGGHFQQAPGRYNRCLLHSTLKME